MMVRFVRQMTHSRVIVAVVHNSTSDISDMSCGWIIGEGPPVFRGRGQPGPTIRQTSPVCENFNSRSISRYVGGPWVLEWRVVFVAYEIFITVIRALKKNVDYAIN